LPASWLRLPHEIIFHIAHCVKMRSASTRISQHRRVTSPSTSSVGTLISSARWIAAIGYQTRALRCSVSPSGRKEIDACTWQHTAVSIRYRHRSASSGLPASVAAPSEPFPLPSGGCAMMSSRGIIAYARVRARDGATCSLIAAARYSYICR